MPLGFEKKKEISLICEARTASESVSGRRYDYGVLIHVSAAKFKIVSASGYGTFKNQDLNSIKDSVLKLAIVLSKQVW